MGDKPKILTSVRIEGNKELFISVIHNGIKYTGYLPEKREGAGTGVGKEG